MSPSLNCRNKVHGPGMQTMDVALARFFAAAERLHLEMRAEAFNALNHSNFGTPNRFVKRHNLALSRKRPRPAGNSN